MKNFINVRIQSYSNTKIKNQLKHFVRYNKSLNQLNDNYNLFLNDDNKIIKLNRTDKLSDIKNIYKQLSDKYDEDRQLHDDYYRKNNKRHVRESASSWGEGVITFSEAIHEDLNNKYSTTELYQQAYNSAKEICQHLGTDLKGLTLHMDEKTPHFHFLYKNFDDNGVSITYQNRTRDKLRPIQDIAFKHFSKLGMERGIKKSDDNLGKYDYIKTSTYKSNQIEQLNSEIDMLKAQIVDYKKMYKEYNTIKTHYKQLRESHAKNSQVYKELTAKIKENQELEKQHRATVKSLNEEIVSKTSSIEDLTNKYNNREFMLNKKEEELTKVYDELDECNLKVSNLNTEIKEHDVRYSKVKKRILHFLEESKNDAGVVTMDNVKHNLTAVYMQIQKLEDFFEKHPNLLQEHEQLLTEHLDLKKKYNKDILFSQDEMIKVKNAFDSKLASKDSTIKIYEDDNNKLEADIDYLQEYLSNYDISIDVKSILFERDMKLKEESELKESNISSNNFRRR